MSNHEIREGLDWITECIGLVGERFSRIRVLVDFVLTLEGIPLLDAMISRRAYHIRLTFQQLYSQPPVFAEAFLKKWYYWATHSRLEPIKEAAYTIKFTGMGFFAGSIPK